MLHVCVYLYNTLYDLFILYILFFFTVGLKMRLLYCWNWAYYYLLHPLIKLLNWIFNLQSNIWQSPIRQLKVLNYLCANLDLNNNLLYFVASDEVSREYTRMCEFDQWLNWMMSNLFVREFKVISQIKYF